MIFKNFLMALVILPAAFIFSCQSRSEKLYSAAYEKINQNEFKDAVELLESSAELEKNNIQKTKALFEAARLLRFEIHDYEKALSILRVIVLQSEDSKMRILSEEAIAEIYFDHLQNYNEALNEFLILEPLLKDPNKKEAVRFKIAQCLRLTGSNQAALDYIDISLKNNPDDPLQFFKLSAQIFQNQKKYDEALRVYEQILEKNPTYFWAENLFTAVSAIHEEKKDYKSGIEYLEKNSDRIPDKSYLELRIKKLKEKQINKPFSKGVRK